MCRGAACRCEQPRGQHLAEIEPIAKPVNGVGRYWLHMSVGAGKPRVNYTLAEPGRITIETNHPVDSKIIIALEMSSS